MGRDSIVSIATQYGLDGERIISVGGEIFRTHPASYTMATGSFLGVKWLGCGIDNPPHLVPRLKKEHSYTSTPLLGLCGLFYGELYLYLFYPQNRTEHNTEQI